MTDGENFKPKNTVSFDMNLTTVEFIRACVKAYKPTKKSGWTQLDKDYVLMRLLP